MKHGFKAHVTCSGLMIIEDSRSGQTLILDRDEAIGLREVLSACLPQMPTAGISQPSTLNSQLP